MTCQVCGASIPDEPDSYEVLVRDVRRRNVPVLQFRVCRRCALAIGHCYLLSSPSSQAGIDSDVEPSLRPALKSLLQAHGITLTED